MHIDRSAKSNPTCHIWLTTRDRNRQAVIPAMRREKFELAPDEKPFDIAVAVRVGALDVRHPEIEKQALHQIAKALTKTGKLYIDGGNPLKE